MTSPNALRAQPPLQRSSASAPVDRARDTRRLESLCRARAALAEVRATGLLIPNQSILINLIPVLEAQASSEIENIVTTTDRLFRFAREAADADPATKEALRYRTALRQGFETLARRPLSTRTAIEVCQTIKGVDIDVRVIPGTALLNGASGQIIYTPPEGSDRLKNMLANWERFIHEAEKIDPLVRMAVMHYQFEAIHPFPDGNGRTGRILNLLFLVDRGLLDLPILYLSRYIIENRKEYYSLLLNVTTDSAWELWIIYMLHAVRETALWTTEKIRAIRDLMGMIAGQMKSRVPKIYSRELVDLIFVQPYCRISDLVDAGIGKRQSASLYLRKLCEVGLLQEIKVGREKLFVNPKLLEALTQR